jgi:hypothetical protein
MTPDLDGMTPDIDPRKERVKQRARVGICIAMVAMVVLLLLRPGSTWVPVAFVIAVSFISPIASTGNLPRGRRRGGGRSGSSSGLSGHGRDDHGRPVGAVAHRWRTLVALSRLMPRSAGQRWLTEAESLLSEITAARRGAAIRSYLLSAPRLVVMMWAREVQRRARLGPRRTG